MGKTSAAVKNRYNDKAYDRINLTVPKGQKARIQEHAAGQGESVNGFIQRAINEAIERDRQTPEG
jgi:predicted HicB family RNase H-like nuclease